MLPDLPEADPSMTQIVPVDFRQEIGRARSVKSKGWLRLLAQEARGRRFERPGLQLIARSQWDFQDYSGARQSLAEITRVSPDNVEANLALVNVYERLAREQKPPDPRCSRCPIGRSRQQAGGIHIQVIDTRQPFARDQGGREERRSAMPYVIQNRDQHLANDGRPKRILALDGGGLRGILSLALLQEIEDILRQRHGGDGGFRLCHYFDLIAGTSTGAIIAATLALGWTVEEIREKYMRLGAVVFTKTLLREGLLRAKYDEVKLIAELKKVYGAQTRLGSTDLKTGLLVMTKRIDTGSPWPISNNPKGKYFSARPDGVVGNGDYLLWQVVRASTAAPAFFDPETITVARVPGSRAVTGEFVDGGVSPFNNPALMSVLYATMAGYRLGWPTGADSLLVVSIGTGAADPNVTHAKVAAKQAVNALLSLMNDTATLQEMLMQWLSSSATARPFDREVGDLQSDLVAGAPVLSYLRYNVDLSRDAVKSLDATLEEEAIESLSAMDAPANMETLHHLGSVAARRDIRPDHFPTTFDLS